MRPSQTSNHHMADNGLCEAAMRYWCDGLNVFPLPYGAKEGIFEWSSLQHERVTERQVRSWWGQRDSPRNIACLWGKVSGGLAHRDFDDPAEYERWKAAHGSLAAILPTFKTARGFGVICRAKLGCVERIRRIHGKSGHGAISVPGGELRADVGCYSILPPSKHPDGPIYRWIIQLTRELPVLDLELEAGFLGEAERYTEYTETSEDSGHSNNVPVVSEDAESSEYTGDAVYAVDSVYHGDRAIGRAIARASVSGPGQRHAAVFRLARELKALPELVDAPLSTLRPIVRCWHARSVHQMRTKPFEESWLDFAEGWSRVKHAAGQECQRAD